MKTTRAQTMRSLALWMLAALTTPVAAQEILHDEPVAGIARSVGYLAADDGTRLAYTMYRPAARGHFPTVAWFDVYGAGSMPPLGMVRTWISRGYAFVAASVRGTGCSEGEYMPFGPQDARDGAAFIDWAGSQDWSNGKVGLIGNSQPGIVQFGIAALSPRHLAAIAPGGSIGRLYSDGWYMGGIYNASFAAHWSRFDQPQASRAGADQRIRLGDEACKTIAGKIGPNSLLSLIGAQRFDADYYRQASPYELAPQVTVPTLMVQSWTDPAIGSSALGVFERLKSAHKRLFVLNGSHDAYLYSTAQSEVTRWMDHWVNGVSNGVDKELRVRVDFETKLSGKVANGEVAEAQPAWSTALRDWPAPDTVWRTLYLTADGKLDDKPATVKEASGTRTYYYPSGTELPGDNLQFSLPPLDWGSLAYRSAPVAQDSAILGSPQLRFFASSEQADTDFMVILHDVSPNGDVTFLQRSYLRASHRAVDLARSTSQLVYHSHLAEVPLKPDKVYEFELSIWPVAYVLRAGHSLELLIAAPSPVPSPGWGFTALMLPGFNTVYQGAEYPSQLRLPLVPKIHAQSPSPECGSLPFQPCRRASMDTSK